MKYYNDSKIKRIIGRSGDWWCIVLEEGEKPLTVHKSEIRESRSFMLAYAFKGDGIVTRNPSHQSFDANNPTWEGLTRHEVKIYDFGDPIKILESLALRGIGVNKDASWRLIASGPTVLESGFQNLEGCLRWASMNILCQKTGQLDVRA